jgi:hypothetical protein
MKISQAAKIWMEYHKANSKKNTIRAYKWVINRYCDQSDIFLSIAGTCNSKKKAEP